MYIFIMYIIWKVLYVRSWNKDKTVGYKWKFSSFINIKFLFYLVSTWGLCGEEMETHFSILAWKIPWTEQPSGLQSGYRVAKSWIRLSVHTHTDTTHTHGAFKNTGSRIRIRQLVFKFQIWCDLGQVTHLLGSCIFISRNRAKIISTVQYY